ncbi:GNAT family N-acetyltransferase [Flavisolibacter sp. BT320]|nr:GNAT family N-acetyltransferase [Flavisolibacter longurius]
MEWTKDAYRITTDKEQINVDYVHGFLSQTYWAENIPLDTVRRSIEGSLCFSVFYGDQQVGFARVITDSATFAYLADVFIDESFRGRGLSKWLVEVIIGHPNLQGLRRFLLGTRDAHGLYQQFGFQPLSTIAPWMQIHQPNVYKEKASSE